LGSIEPNESNREIVANSLYGLGRWCLYTGDHEQAQRLFDKAMEVLPSLASEMDTQL
jgi:hypothetical protein